MAFSSASTLQQTDEVAAVASASAGAGGGGGGVTADAIASALDHDPGLSGGIQTTVRASATDDALITEQAVADQIQSAQGETKRVARRLVQTQADIDALDAVTVRRSRELIAGNAIGPLGDLSADRTVTVQEEDLAGTFLASDGSGALAVQTTGDLVGDGNGQMQIGQSVVQTREIDESIAPTWTGVHTHAADIEMQDYQVRFDDGVLQGDGNGALEVLKADESNQGVLRVDEIVAHTVTVVDEIDQRNVNDLRVEDQYIVVNENQSGTPGLDGGLVAERGGLEDAYIEWEEGLDVWGTRLENGTLKPITLRDTSMTDTGIPYWNQQEERIETAADLTYKEAQSNGFYNGNEVQTSAGVGHPDYTAKLEHWYITPGGLGDFRTLLADELRVEAFIAEVEEALAGSDFLTKSFGTLDEPFVVPSSGAVGTQKDLTVRDLDGLGATPVFGNNTDEQDDTLRLRIVDRSGDGLTVADIWLRVFAGSYTDNGDGTQTWTVEILQAGDSGIGAGLTAPTGSVVLDYGVPGDFLIERSVLDPDSGDIAPYDRMLKWRDTTGDRIPDEFDVLNLRGRLDGLPKAYASGFGTYTETGRFTSDVAIGDLEAADQDSNTGSYLRYTEADGLKIVNSDGYEGAGDNSYSNAILQLEDDVRLLARRLTQEGESRAGVELKANENAASIKLNAEIIGDGSGFSKSTLSLQASQNESDTSTNASAITSLASIVGDGSGLSKSTLTLQAEQNETDAGNNASAISTLESQVGSGNIQAGASLTLAANQNTDDTSTNASAISTLETTLSDNGITASTNLTQRVSEAESSIKLVARRLTQERESRAGVELKANETAARFQADVRFEGSTASVSLVANSDGSTARLAGDSIILDGDTTVKGVAIADKILAEDANITGTLKMGDSNSNGIITNTNSDYQIDQSGFSIAASGSSITPERAYVLNDENENRFGAIWGNTATGGKALTLETFNDGERIELVSEGSIRFLSDSELISFQSKTVTGEILGIDIQKRNTDPPSPSGNFIRLYMLEESDGNINLYAKNSSGNTNRITTF